MRFRAKGIYATFTSHDRKGRKIDRAIKRAYRAFASRHPELVRSLFDLHFLEHSGVGAVENFRCGVSPDPEELARAWILQWGFSPEVADWHVQRVLPAVDEFVSAVEMEFSIAGLILNRSTLRSPVVATATYG